MTLPGGNEFRPNFLSETPRDITLRVSDILRQVELYPNEIKRQELDIIVKGLRQKGLDYLLEADELYEYDGPTQTLRQNGGDHSLFSPHLLSPEFVIAFIGSPPMKNTYSPQLGLTFERMRA